MKAPTWMRGGAQGRLVRRARRRRLAAALRGRTAGIVATVVGAMAIATLTVFWPVGSSEDSDDEPTVPTPDTTVIDAGPLTVAIEQVTKATYCRATWMVPRSPDDIDFTDDVEAPGGNVDLDWSEHSAGEGGGPASPLQVYITVQGTSDAEVMLTRIVPHIRRLGPAPAGTVLHRQCGGPGEFRWLDVDLDAPDAPLRSEVSEDLARSAGVPEAEVVPIEFPYGVSRSDAETFLVEAHTVACDCEWWLDLHWQSAGEAGVVTIDDRGDPFRTIATTQAFATCTQDGSCGPATPRP